MAAFLGEIVKVKVWLIDHLDAGGHVLPPIPDRGQLTSFESRLTTRFVSND